MSLDSITEHFQWIGKYWHVLAGSSAALWWTAVRIKRSMFTNYPTFSDMEECKVDLVKVIEEHEKREAEKFNRLEKTNNDTHDRLEGKIDRIIDHLLDTKDCG